MSSAEPVELRIPNELIAFDIALSAVGAFILIVWGYRHLKRRRDIDIPLRPNRLSLELAVLPLMWFVLCLLGFSWLAERFGPDLSDEARNLLAFTGAQTLGLFGCVVVGHVTFQRRAVGFLLGDRQITRHILWGLGGLAASFPLCWLAAESSIWLLHWLAPEYSPPQHDVLGLLHQTDLPRWFLLLLWTSAVVVAPLAEEAFFRGICQSALSRVLGKPLWAVVIVSVLFGLAHSSQPQVVVSLTVLGLFLGFVYERTGSLLAPVTLHALFNLKTMIFFTIAT